MHNKGRIEAFRYLNEWGTKFWTTSQDCIQQITTYIEKELSGKAGLDGAQIATLRVGGKLSLSETQVHEIKHRGDEIINSVQMNRLSTLMDSLNQDVLTDSKRRYYIIVDSLDESWVDERLKAWLIRGLIETIRTFNKKIHHAKIIIALRTDLLARVYKATSDGGFQEEKYSGLNLNIIWTRDELRQLLDARVQALVRQRYTKEPVKLKDVLRGNVSKRKDSETAIDYLLDRTLLRPRDAIQFLNACLEQAIDQPAITLQM